MSQNLVNKSYYGYTGMYRQPYANAAGYGDSLYLITDEAHFEANLIVLSDHFFRDAYRILSQPTYQEVHIFVPSIDMVWISDIFGLVMSLKAYKKNVYWHYPDKYYPKHTNVLFEMAQILLPKYQSKVIPGLTIDMVKENDVYSFKVINGKKREYFSVWCKKDDAIKLINSGLYDAIHLPYNTFYYAGTSAREIACDTDIQKLARKVVPNSFRNRDEFVEAAHLPFAVMDRLLG